MFRNQNRSETLLFIALDRDECITNTLASGYTPPNEIVRTNPLLVSYFKQICLMKDHKFLRVGSSRQRQQKNLNIINEYSGFEQYGKVEGLQAPTGNTLLSQVIPDYQDDYSKFLIVLGHMAEIQALLKKDKYKKVTHVEYCFIDDKPDKLIAIMRALHYRPDLVPNKVGAISFVSYVHKDQKKPEKLATLYFDNNHEQDIDFLSEIQKLRDEYENNLGHPLFKEKEKYLRDNKKYNRAIYSIDLALSIETTALASVITQQRDNQITNTAFIGFFAAIVVFVALAVFFPPAIVAAAGFLHMAGSALITHIGVGAAFSGAGLIIGGLLGGGYWKAKAEPKLLQELAPPQVEPLAPHEPLNLSSTAQVQSLHHIPIVNHGDNPLLDEKEVGPLIVIRQENVTLAQPESRPSINPNR